MKQFQRLFQIEREGFVTLSEIACDGVASLLLMVVRPLRASADRDRLGTLFRLANLPDGEKSGEPAVSRGNQADFQCLRGAIDDHRNDARPDRAECGRALHLRSPWPARGVNGPSGK